MTRRTPLLAALLSLTLLVAACGDDDDGDAKGAATSTTSTTATTVGGGDGGADGSTAGGESFPLDEALAAKAIAGPKELFGFAARAVEDDGVYRTMLERTCAAVREGHADGAPAATVAQAIADGVPPGPEVVGYTAMMLTIAQGYLYSGGDCGADPAYALEVREALVPLTTDAAPKPG